ncbi:MAG: arylsulfatase [Bryobacteraceae bacterium]
MNRRQFIGSLSAGAAAAQTRRTAAPNILLIVADDLGYGDLGCYGQTRIQTPNLDRLAAEGVRFSQAYAGSTVCAPSRCCLMTGLHTGHARTRGNKFPDLPLRPQDITIAEVLKQAGYRCGIFGKWSLGGLSTTGYPLRKGFDEWFGFFSQTHAHTYYPDHLLHNEREVLLRGNFGVGKKKDYAHDLVTQYALRYLEQRDERPFFVHLAYTIPHANNEMGRDTGNGMEVPTDAPYSGRNWPQQEKNFAAMITRMDSDVGKVMDQLKASGRDENTLVVFTSDNGPHSEGGHNPSFFESRGPLRGIKRDMYEGGIRVPTLARWPGKIQAGRVSDQVMAFWDLLPTCAELAGAKPPEGLDGISMAPALLGKLQRDHEYLYWEFHERGFHQAVRMGDWKGVRLGSRQPVELYNLSTDLSERENVAGRHPEVASKIERILQTARTESAEWPIKERN